MKHIVLFLALVVSVPLLATPSHASPIVKVSYDVEGTKNLDPKLDLLFVVDDSGSMDPHQKNLVAAIAQMAGTFQNMNVDLQAAVTTTSTSARFDCSIPSGQWQRGSKACDGKFNAGYISNRSPDFASALAQRLQVGTYGAPEESVFAPVLLALDSPLKDGENKGFLRSDAALAIVFVTDAEDQSGIEPSEFASRVLALKNGDKTLISVFAALNPTSGTPNCSRNDQSTPLRIEAAVALLGGKAFNICSQTMGGEIGDAIAKLDAPSSTIPVKVREFKLPTSPDLSTLKVTFGSRVLTAGDVLGGWTYRSNSNKVFVGENFDYSLEPEGTKLVIEFESNFKFNGLSKTR